MIGYLLTAGGVALGGVWGSWKSWSATDPVFKQSWRGWTIRALLGAVALTLLAFAFHLASAMADWAYLPRGPFDDLVRLCFCVSFVPVLAVAIGRGGLRVFPALAGLGSAWLWLLVGAASM